MNSLFSVENLQLKLGEDIKHLRLIKNINRNIFCNQAGISMNALIHLENGSGATIKTLIKVVKELNKVDWLLGIAPTISINPLNMVRGGKLRKRARYSKKIRLVKKPLTKGFVYFIQEHGRGHIKIGYSAKPALRLKSLQTSCGVKLTLLKTHEGTQKEEKALHKRFKHLRLKGEWFVPSKDLLNFIESI